MTLRHTITVHVDDRSGEVARIVGLVHALGLDLEALTVTRLPDPAATCIVVHARGDAVVAARLARRIAQQVRVLGVETAVAIPGQQVGAGTIAERCPEKTAVPFEGGRMQVYYDRDVNPEALSGRTVAVIGYGSQGHAQAANLRDSGCDVCVGLRPGGASWSRATEAGFRVLTTAEAAEAGDLVMLLVPDECAPEVYRESVAPAMRPGKLLGFSHGFSIHFGFIDPPEGVGVFMVAPKGPGHLVRREFARGAGVPCLVAIHRDPAGDCRQAALAYASAIGGGRAGLIETTFREETETDLFGEQAVLCGGLAALIKAGFETLVDAGYAPEMAYFECLHEMKLIVDLLHEGGLGGMRASISTTAAYGAMTRGPEIVTNHTRRRMEAVLESIRSGAFAREWMAEHAAGRRRFARLRDAEASHPIEAVGTRLRDMMPWLRGRGLESASR